MITPQILDMNLSWLSATTSVYTHRHTHTYICTLAKDKISVLRIMDREHDRIHIQYVFIYIRDVLQFSFFGGLSFASF